MVGIGHGYKASGIWKSILSVKDDFVPLVHCRAHNGRRIRFWNDEWCGQTVLYHQFPNLFMLDKRQNAFVIYNFSYSEGGSCLGFVLWKESFGM